MCNDKSTYICRYHLKDVIIGKIYFLLVRIKIKNMDLEIRRRESTGSGANTHVETETLAKFELMDGAPVRGMLRINLRSLCLYPCTWVLPNHFPFVLHQFVLMIQGEHILGRGVFPKNCFSNFLNSSLPIPCFFLFRQSQKTPLLPSCPDHFKYLGVTS